MPNKRCLQLPVLQLLLILLIACAWNRNSYAYQSAMAQPAASAPAFSPSGGAYSSAQSVSIGSATANATIYYTTDGTTPTNSSKIYTGPISITSTSTLRAIAIGSGYSTSSITTQTYVILPPVGTPLISPSAGTYPAGTTVTLSDATPGASIYYTTNGTLPSYSAARYNGPFVLASSETITAVALASGYSPSSPGSATYTILPIAAAPVLTPAPGSFTSTQTVYISDKTPTAAIYYTTNGTAPTSASTLYTGPITLSATETVSAIAVSAGYWQSPSTTGSYVLTPPAAMPVLTPAPGTYTSTQQVTIADTTPGAVVYYTVNGTAPTTSSPKFAGPIAVSTNQTIDAMAIAPGYSQSPTAAATYTITPPAATPTFFPAAGTYVSPQRVFIKDATPNALIYYTIDGTTPTAASLSYSGPIPVTATETINAIAMAAGNPQSAVASATYTLTPPTATPVFTPAAGTYTSGPSVSILDSTPGATIYYTTDGTTPTVSSQQYTGAIAVSATEKLSAMALAPGFSQSAVAGASYTVTPPAATPAFSIPGGSYTGAQSISITDSTSGAQIYYTTNGTAPSTSSTPYTGPIVVSSTLCLHAIAVAQGFSPSATASASYSFPASLAIATAPGLPGGYVGAPYSAQIVASGAGPGYTWSVNGNPVLAGGSPLQLPGGITASSSGNYLLTFGGTPSIAGTVTLSVAVTDTYSGAQAGPVAFSIRVSTPSALSLPAPTPGTLGPATAHAPYFGFLGVTGGVPPYQWTVSGLPSTLTYVTGTVISTLAGSGAAGFGGDGGAAIGAQIDASGGLAVDGSGNVYFSDAVSSRVRMISPAGIITTVAGTGTAGYNGDSIAAAQAQLNSPAGLAVDRAGDLYIADSGNARIRMVSAATGQITTVAGNGTAGYNGENLAATVGELNMPTGVALDRQGDLYIADSGNARVREVSAITAEISTVAGTGNAGFSGDAGPATAAHLKNPFAVAVDAQGNLYISDLTGVAGAAGTGGRIREVIAATGVINTIAGNGAAGCNGDGIAAVKAQLSNPIAIALDSSGNLYIADTGNDRVRVVSAGIIRTAAGTGAAGYNGDGIPAFGANLVPQGVATDNAGDLFVADGAGRIRLVPVPAQNSELVIEGTSAAAGPITVQASVQDSTGTIVGPVIYTINVSAPLALALPVANPGSLPAAVAGQAYSGTIVVSGGVPGYKWYVNGSRFPAAALPVALAGGLTYSSTGSTLLIGGTPLSPGVLSFPVSIVDGMGNKSGPITYSIDVVSAPGYPVSGQVSYVNCGAPASGIALAINTNPAQVTSTNANGQFAFQNVPAGSYLVTPSSSAPTSVFFPASQAAMVASGSIAGINFSAELGYTVSGSVSLPPGMGGRVYVNLINNSCPESVLGTSIPASTAFSIRGVQPGTYTLQAWVDEFGFGVQNAADGVQVIPQLVVSQSNLTAISVTPVAPAPLTLASAPVITEGGGFTGGAFLAFTPIVGSNGIEQATSYTLQWSSSSSFGSVAGSRSFAATGASGLAAAWFVNGLPSGATYYFRAQGTAGNSAGPWSAVYGPITTGTPSAGYVISGTVTFAGPARGPLFVGFVDDTTGKAYVGICMYPGSPQNYAVLVPPGPHYRVFALVDQNKDGMTDTGDINDMSSGQYVAVTGNMTLNLTMPLPNAAAVTTQHYRNAGPGGALDTYALDFNVSTTDILPLKLTLISGPNVLVPMDIGNCGTCGSEPYSFWLDVATAVPQPGDTYALQFLDPWATSAGTFANANAVVSGVVNSFAGNFSPITGTGAGTTPTFSWTDPPNAGSYTYQFTLWDPNGNVIWQIPGATAGATGFSSAIISIAWGTDPTGANNPPSVPSLTAGESYTWSIQVQDGNGNTAEMPVSYTP